MLLCKPKACWLAVAVAGVCLQGWITSAEAVVVSSLSGTTGNPAANLVNPNNGLPWDNVGATGSSTNGVTAVYLGDGWVLGVTHSGTGSPVRLFSDTPSVGGISYGRDNNVPLHYLSNPDPNNGTPDLVMWKLTVTPALPKLNILNTSPISNTQVTMVGTGLERAGDRITVVSGITGYAWDTVRDKVWGNNKVSVASQLETIDGKTTWTFRTTFQGTTGYSQLTSGDSGAPLFISSAGQWYLAGLGLATSTYVGQTPNTSGFGNQSYFADLSKYKTEIEETIAASIPEPTSIALLGLMAPLMLRRTKKQ